MRDEAVACWLALADREDFVFLTGDLGFRALEPLRDALGERFLNCGVAEQNMLSVAAGLASEGLDVWAYSIAPFCYARPLEQIRNDLCMHRLPVKLVGNGGGYAYGAMGATHHALEDYGTLLGLQGMRVLVPAFGSDLETMVPALAQQAGGPAYLRLGRCEQPESYEPPAYAPWRRLLEGDGAVVVATGPLVGGLLGALLERPGGDTPELWALSELPLQPDAVPVDLRRALERTGRLCVVEEHVASGGVGQMLAHFALSQGIQLEAFEHAAARGYPSGRYGSQAFHRKESGLDAASLLGRIDKLRARR